MVPVSTHKGSPSSEMVGVRRPRQLSMRAQRWLREALALRLCSSAAMCCSASAAVLHLHDVRAAAAGFAHKWVGLLRELCVASA